MIEGSDKVKRPASQYYWGDWFKDLALQSCSLPARGLWHEMNCLMHQGEPYGHLTMPNGKGMGPMQLANLCKIGHGLCKKLLEELEENGVFSRTPEGVVFSRRMVRDEAIRQARAEGGKAGAEHGIKGAEAGKKGGRPVHPEGGSETPLKTTKKPPPSSSSSSSPSGGKDPNGSSSAAKLPPCPHQAIVKVYHEVLPEMAKVVLMGDPRKRALQSLWRFVLTSTRSDGTPRASSVDEALAWIRSYFERARENDFLMGRTPPSKGHEGWKCDLDFLLTEKGKHHVIEKTGEGS